MSFIKEIIRERLNQDHHLTNLNCATCSLHDVIPMYAYTVRDILLLGGPNFVHETPSLFLIEAHRNTITSGKLTTLPLSTHTTLRS